MTDKWINDTGLVFAFFFLILGYGKGNKNFLIISGVFLLALIFLPSALYSIAFVWQKLTELLGLVVPKIFFGLVFFVIILPVGVLRRFLKGDALLITTWREAHTVFIKRNHLFIKHDIETPY